MDACRKQAQHHHWPRRFNAFHCARLCTTVHEIALESRGGSRVIGEATPAGRRKAVLLHAFHSETPVRRQRLIGDRVQSPSRYRRTCDASFCVDSNAIAESAQAVALHTEARSSGRCSDDSSFGSIRPGRDSAERRTRPIWTRFARARLTARAQASILDCVEARRVLILVSSLRVRRARLGRVREPRRREFR